VTFSRGSQATLFDSTGTLKYAKHNLLLQSQNFATTWSANNVSVSTDSTSAPDGTTTADTLNDGVVAAASHSLIQTPTIGVSTTYVASFFAKNVDRRYVGFAISTTSSNNYGTVEFDLNGAGAVSRTAVLGTGFAIVSSSITSVGDGWFRCVATITTGTAAVTDGRTTLYLSDGAGAFDSRGRATYSGANASIYAWGAQFNLANMEGGVTSSLTTYYPTTTAAYYAPRFDYNPSTLQPLGLLIEEQRTNSFPNSNDFSNATYWTVYGTAVATAGAATGPDGLTSASNLAGATDTTLSGNNIEESVSISASTAYTFSVFVKSNGGTEVVLRLRDSTGGSTSTATLTVTSAWQCISLTRTMAVGATSVRCIIGQTNGNILIYGAQLEAGAFATSYIPTTTTALTRNADVATMTGTNFSSWYNTSEGTLFAQFLRTAPTNSSQARVFSLSVGANTGLIELYQVNVTDPAAQIINTATQAQWLTSGYVVGAPIRQALAYKLNDSNASFNGSAETPDTVCTIPSVTQANIGNRQDLVRALNGYVQRLSYYPTRLPNSTLQALTA